MKKLIKKTPTSDEINHISRVEPLSLKDIIYLPIKSLLSTIDLQKALFLSSFFTYGVGDGATAVYMMEITGVMREGNPVVRFIYSSSGQLSCLAYKVWYVTVVLSIVWIVSKKKQIYWTINGFLFALTLGGIMAMRANTMAAFGMDPPAPGPLVITFLFMVILFVMIGDQMDNLQIDVR
ncbi:MAG: hypothetical protein O8C63_07840 [Candidatus Methanoperedens sp.]|nr:hypothetical protein [Candidatus Methanoperedens sp.]